MSNLKVTLQGAPPKLLERAARAALAHLSAVGVTPEEAAIGRFARDGWDVRGLSDDDEPSADEMRWATAMDGAEDQAQKIFQDSGVSPIGFGIEIDQQTVLARLAERHRAAGREDSEIS